LSDKCRENTAVKQLFFSAVICEICWYPLAVPSAFVVQFSMPRFTVMENFCAKLRSQRHFIDNFPVSAQKIHILKIGYFKDLPYLRRLG
jgi:hypothetical protein